MEKTTIYKQLLLAQKQIGAAIKGKENPYFKSNYADLQIVIDCIKGPLNDNGIVFLQPIKMSESGQPVIETILIHADSGESLSFEAPIYCVENKPQSFGSGVTYTKRYALQALLGLPTADDDGNTAEGKSKSKKLADREKNLTNKAVRDLKKKPLTDVEMTALTDFADHWGDFYKTKVTPEEMAEKILAMGKSIPRVASVVSIKWILDNIKPDSENE